ncbi:MAG TPA: SDR family NAD(P)-dependent oxidoreductase [Solirubrobacteraceae bacterium]|nr:SDR family NAD(P)-dependent oxidoreductase [Solirubrobacteraceae bacterium]
MTGATGGIGAAVARRLAADGARLVLSGRRADVLAELADETQAEVIAADLSDPADVDRLAEQAGEIDILIANAGLPATGRLAAYTTVQIDRALDVNLRAPMILANALTPGMVARGRGHVVFMSSIAGKTATPRSSIYNATKFGLRGFSLALRAELRPSGVGVSAIFPGFIRDAGMFAETGIKLPPGVGTRTPDHVAKAVVRAIRHNKAELDVAPLGLRASAVLAGIAPELVLQSGRLLQTDRVAQKFEDRQAAKR